MDRIVVIANPAASQFTGGSHRDVMAILDRSAEVEAVWPGSTTDAEEMAHEATRSGANIVVAMGGDGMAHHVAQGVVGTEASLGVIPVGTTNVFARLMGIPSKAAKAARFLTTAARHPKAIGVAKMTLQRGSTETTHHAVFACGVGLDAAVVLVADSEPYRKYRFGSVHYARSAVGVAFRDFPRRRSHVTVTSDDHHRDATSALVQFRDVYTYFGRLPLRVSSVKPDPMTVMIMGRLRRRRVPRIAVAAFAGRDLDQIPEIDIWPQVKRLELKADPPVAAQADGESLGMIDAGTIEWIPDCLRLLVPQLSPR